MMCWILACAGGLHAQIIHEYDYDACGNRIRRRVITLKAENAPGFAEGRECDTAALDDGDVRLYPNPTRGVVVFEPADGAAIAKYCLSDANGRLIETEKAPVSSLRLDLSGRPPGVYLLEVLLEGGRKYYKIIKQ